MSWQEDLQNKFNMIKKEEDDVHTQINSGHDNRDSGGRISSLRVSRRNGQTTEINNGKEKEAKGMITVEGALKDLEAIEKETTDIGAKAIVKGLKVVVKFLSTIRSNQLLTDEEKIAIRKARETRQAKEKK